MKSKVIRASQSPLNKLQWLCELDCGHEQWVTSKRKPRVVECSAQHSMHVDSAIAVDGHVGLLAEIEVGDDVVPIPPSQ